MPRNRPSPEFPAQGFLGQQPVEGGMATEWGITIPHPTQFGRWTNVPSLVPGQTATGMLPGTVMLPEQYQRAMQFARWLVEQGWELPNFPSLEGAVRGAGRRHRRFER